MTSDAAVPFASLLAELAEDDDERALMGAALALLAHAPEAAEPPAALRERMLLEARRSTFAPTFFARGDYFAHGDELEWLTLAPGITLKWLYRDAASGARTALIRMEPNLLFPEHPHPQIEDLYLVEGDAWVGDTPIHAGDYCRAEAGTAHTDVRSGPSGSLAIVVSR